MFDPDVEIDQLSISFQHRAFNGSIKLTLSYFHLVAAAITVRAFFPGSLRRRALPANS
jgi:hypothetical protein